MKGIKKWRAGDAQVSRMTNVVLPEGTYEMKLVSEKAEERKPKGTDAQGKPILKDGKPKVLVPYVGNFYFETTDENKTRVYHNFYLSLLPGKDGVQNPNRGGGIAEFAQATNNADFEPDVVEGQIETSEGEDVPFLSPDSVIEFLKGLDGTIVKVAIKNETGSDKVKRHAVDFFVAEDTTPAEEEPATTTSLKKKAAQ